MLYCNTSQFDMEQVLCRMTNPLTMWNSCGIYTNLPYGYDPGFKGSIPGEGSQRAISDRQGYQQHYEDDGDYYYYEYYYDDDNNDVLYDRIDPGDPAEFSDRGILDNILDIILNRKKKPVHDGRPIIVPDRNRKRRFPLPQLPPIPAIPSPEILEEKTSSIFDGIGNAIGRAVSNVGFFGVLLPGILAGM